MSLIKDGQLHLPNKETRPALSATPQPHAALPGRGGDHPAVGAGRHHPAPSGTTLVSPRAPGSGRAR